MRTQDNLLSNITNGGEIIVSRPDDLFSSCSASTICLALWFSQSAVKRAGLTAIIKATEMDLDLKVMSLWRAPRWRWCRE